MLRGIQKMSVENNLRKNIGRREFLKEAAKVSAGLELWAWSFSRTAKI